ncbi:MAG: Hsp20/alpha crystallin family protein [Candidatus Magasanikbacteria bacterium]|uniref:SHSP domain-containing protein n=1 Tax=Candidatus Magasanikbacteria bacterium CG10_big_fil_rev_8_21_14_0_10_38_6 TaxID=1974647 RepID=A0A2M6P0L3_9BACT|nr:Hsp20/alpha crystallin family protein [Candidatus Magasanikbacteria bacterium]NCS72441.1 Hsp20/alpha crystallin family protein [Candidatus Magasanikbacteria bacterium]PIR77099.1 MAG: hypothetical protein COU30_04300 [Candidatus Magasanikbacteria bacterium CG10_big_fil_rev_8_21_14_0_10_38_6]
MNDFYHAAFHTRSIPVEQDAMWKEMSSEGELSLNVYLSKGELVVVAPMAGADPKGFSLSIRDDLLTIKGKRVCPVATRNKEETYLEESFWGTFSRTVVLPIDVKSEFAKAEYKYGLLTIRIPIREVKNTISVTIVDE